MGGRENNPSIEQPRFSLASDRSPDRRYIVQRIQDVSTKAKLNGSVGIQPFRPSTTATLSAARTSIICPSEFLPLALFRFPLETTLPPCSIYRPRIEMNKYRVPHSIKLYMALHPRAKRFRVPQVYKTAFRGCYTAHNTRYYANLYNIYSHII